MCEREVSSLNCSVYSVCPYSISAALQSFLAQRLLSCLEPNQTDSDSGSCSQSYKCTQSIWKKSIFIISDMLGVHDLSLSNAELLLLEFLMNLFFSSKKNSQSFIFDMLRYLEHPISCSTTIGQ